MFNPARISVIAVLLIAHAHAASASSQLSAKVSHPSFNPALGESVVFHLGLPASGRLTVSVLDRDGYLVKTLLSDEAAKPGELDVPWDGKDASGVVVPDEAYSIKAELRGASGTYSFFPATASPRIHDIRVNYFDRGSGSLAYTLPEPCRVHIQAGTTDPSAKDARSGAVLRTIVNREPRAAGNIIESWNGFDESGNEFVPNLPHFVVSIFATSLPESAVMTTGNRSTSFVDWSVARGGKSLLPPYKGKHRQHEGLEAPEDVSPQLALSADGIWDDMKKTWKLAEGRVHLTAALKGSNAKAFAGLPSTLQVFVDGRHVSKSDAGRSPRELDVSLSGVEPGTHIVTVNWATPYGPVAVNTIRVELPSGKH